MTNYTKECHPGLKRVITQLHTIQQWVFQRKNINNMEELVSLASTTSVIELWGRVLTQADWEDGVPLSIEGAMG